MEEEGRLGSLTAIFPAEAICVCCEREGCEQISNLIRTSCMALLPSVLFKALRGEERKHVHGPEKCLSRARIFKSTMGPR